MLVTLPGVFNFNMRDRRICSLILGVKELIAVTGANLISGSEKRRKGGGGGLSE